MWEHRYHEIQECGNEICERIFVPRFRSDEKISAEALFKPVRVNGSAATSVMLTLWPLDVKDQKVAETSYYSGMHMDCSCRQRRAQARCMSPCHRVRQTLCQCALR